MFSAQAQEENEVLLKQEAKANELLVEANDKIASNNFIEAEMVYRKAISTKPSTVAGTYNLAHSYYKKNNFEESLFRHQQAAKNAVDKEEKHKAFHNIGNILMKEKKCKEAVEAFKSALRNNPKDDETRYNLALAQECAKQQQDDNPQEDDKDGDNNRDKDENKDEENKENNEQKKEQDKQDQKDQGDQDKDQENKDKDENGDPKDDKKDKGDKGEQEQKQPQQQKGQMSPQQIKNLLEAMNNEEQKVQEKMNAQKAKGVKVQTDKDW